MITNPNTLNLFKSKISQITKLIHKQNNQIYKNNTNTNTIMNHIHTNNLNINILHINLHKTFTTPHNKKNPKSNPIYFHNHLTPFQPQPIIIQTNNTYQLNNNHTQNINQIHTFQNNFNIFIHTYTYIHKLKKQKLTNTNTITILNTHYL